MSELQYQALSLSLAGVGAVSRALALERYSDGDCTRCGEPLTDEELVSGAADCGICEGWAR